MTEKWVTLAVTQLTCFLVGAYFVHVDSDLVPWVWALTGLAGFILTFGVSSLRLLHSGAGRYLLGLILTLVASSAFWALVIVVCAMTHLTNDSLLVVSMFFLWVPALVLWSTGCYSLLILGPFVPTKVER